MKFPTQIVSVIIIGVLLSGCIRTVTLTNGITKVPAKPKAYKNKVWFVPSLLLQIDTSIVYEEVSIRYNTLCRLDNHSETEYYHVCRFYSNGDFNKFTMVRGEDDSFDPSYHGHRGVFYESNKAIVFDFWASTSELGLIGKIKGEIKVSGDTLIMQTKSPSERTEMYIKRKVLPRYLQYDANW